MAHVLIGADFGPLLSGDPAAQPITLRLDLSAIEPGRFVDSMALWFLAEIKQQRQTVQPASSPDVSGCVAPKRFVIARFRKVVRFRKGVPPRAFYVRAA